MDEEMAEDNHNESIDVQYELLKEVSQSRDGHIDPRFPQTSPQIDSFQNFRTTATRSYRSGSDVLLESKIPIMTLGPGLPRFDLLDSFHQDVACRSEIVRLRYMWNRFVNMTTFLEQLPNVKCLILPGRSMRVAIDLSLWTARLIQRGTDAADEVAHRLMKLAVHDMLPQDWSFAQPRKSVRMLSEIIVENESDDLEGNPTTTHPRYLPGRFLRIVLARDITHTETPEQMDNDTLTTVLYSEFIHRQRFQVPNWETTDLIAANEQYELLRRQNPTKTPADITSLLIGATYSSDDEFLQWVTWSATHPGFPPSFKQSQTWQSVLYTRDEVD